MRQERPPILKGRDLTLLPLGVSSLMREYPSMWRTWCPVTVPATMAEAELESSASGTPDPGAGMAAGMRDRDARAGAGGREEGIREG